MAKKNNDDDLFRTYKTDHLKFREYPMMWGPEEYLIHVDYRSDFVAGSGLSVGGQLGSIGANIAIVGFLLLAVLAIISKFLEWGEGDMNPNGLLGILARAGFLAILGGIISTLIQSL